MPSITVHLQAADGATADLLVQLPPIRTRQVRISTINAASIQAAHKWDGTKWVAT